MTVSGYEDYQISKSASIRRNQLPAVSHVPEDIFVFPWLNPEGNDGDATVAVSVRFLQDAMVNLVGCFAESQLEQAFLP